MTGNDYRQSLAVAHQAYRDLIVQHGKYSDQDKSDRMRELDDIMLASIRTLRFVWDNEQAQRSLETLLDIIIRRMADVTQLSTAFSSVYLQEHLDNIMTELRRKQSVS